jgi:hypothetical protein
MKRWYLVMVPIVPIAIGIGMMGMVTMAFGQGGNEFTVPLTDPAKRGKLKAHLNYGSIKVSGTARKDVLVKYTEAADNDGDHDRHNDKDKSSNSKEGMKRIGGGGMSLEASVNDNLVKVSSGSWNVKTNLEIEVPSGMDLNVSTYNDGDVTITNIQGEVELTNYNGAITALNISGSVVATTYNGDIRVTFDKVTEGKPMSYFTYNGDVDISYPAATKATFKLKTDQGDIYTGFDMNVTSSGPVKQEDKKGGFKLKIDEWKRGDINGGGAEMTLKTYNGDIYIRKKPA